MEEAQALMEQLQQLKASNEQLREQLQIRQTQSTQVSDPCPGSSNTNMASMSNASHETANIRYVYAPKDRKCPKFTGKMSIDMLTVNQWVEEVRRCLEVRHMPISEQVLFVIDHLDGGAKAEVNFHPSLSRNTPEKIFAILTENYCCKQSYVAAQLQLFQRTQREGESLREYSHALKSLMEVAIRKTPGGIPNNDMILRDQFIEHISDETLRRELKQRIVRTPDIPFIELRAEAIGWTEASRPNSKTRSRAFSCDSHYADVVEADSNVVAIKPIDEIAEIKESLRKQQSQLDTIMQHLTAQLPRTEGNDVPQSFVKRPRVQADGKPICYRCNKPGHIARYCRVNLNPGNRRALSVSEAALRSQVLGEGPDSQPSEN
ncbi:unnamed protein product [Knipowitschia caucasica]